MFIDKEKTNYLGKDLEAMMLAHNYNQWILKEIGSYLSGVTAEVGAGTGTLTGLLASRVKELHSFEPSSNMFPVLESEFSGEKKVRLKNEFFTETAQANQNFFDAIVYINVMEHIKDDFAEMKLMEHSLKPSGYGVIFVPAIQALYSDFDRKLGHYRRYDKKRLRQIAKEANLEIVRLSYFDFVGIIPWFIVFKLLRRSLTGSDVSFYDRFVIPIISRIESTIRPPIGKNLLLVVRK